MGTLPGRARIVGPARDGHARARPSRIWRAMACPSAPIADLAHDKRVRARRRAPNRDIARSPSALRDLLYTWEELIEMVIERRVVED